MTEPDVDELVSLAAHALKTPLAVIAGYSELLRARDDPALHAEGLAQIAEAARRLGAVTDDVLALVSLDTSTHVEPVELAELVEEAAAGFEARTGRPLKRAGIHDVPAVAGDRDQLLALLGTLAGAFPSGEEPLVLGAVADGGYGVLTIRCAGAGVVRDSSRFARYVARRLAEANGGALFFEGSTATLKLRLAGAHAGGVLRVLIVDDDESVRTLLRLTLPADAFAVTEAADGDEAMELIERDPPDAVLLDWLMPGRSGAEVLAELRSEHPGLPVIVLTSDRTPRARREAEALGVDIFLTKPFSPRELLGVVERLLPPG